MKMPPLPPMPSLSLSGGNAGPAKSSFSGTLGGAADNPFVFKNDGWVVNLRSNGNSNTAGGGDGVGSLGGFDVSQLFKYWPLAVGAVIAYKFLAR